MGIRKPARSHSQKIYFFSDAHLGIADKKTDRIKEQRLVRFLDHVGVDADRLFILGDLFDYWFEYRTVVPKGYTRLLGKLAELTDGGVSISYLAGNHDFWTRGYFEDELGIQVFSDPVDQTFSGTRFYLHHGDGIVKSDRGYRFLKKVLRNKTNISLFSLLHPDLASRLAHWSSRTSRHHTSGRTMEGEDMADFAAAKIRSGSDVVIMGHNHAATLQRINGGIYVNLGDWIDHCTYAVFDGSTLSLCRWNNGSKYVERAGLKTHQTAAQGRKKRRK